MPAIQLSSVMWAAVATLALIFLGQWGRARRQDDKGTLSTAVRGFTNIVSKWTKAFVAFASLTFLIVFDVGGLTSGLLQAAAMDPFAGAAAIGFAISVLQSIGRTSLTLREVGLTIAIVYAVMFVIRFGVVFNRERQEER